MPKPERRIELPQNFMHQISNIISASRLNYRIDAKEEFNS